MKTIPLTKGMTTIVDDEDYEWASQFTWTARKGRGDSFYASRRLLDRRADGTLIPSARELQRELLDPEWLIPISYKADHRNGDTLDNRRHNLRIVNDSASNANRGGFGKTSSGFKGVTYEPQKSKTKPWVVRVKLNGKIYYGPMQPDPISGAKAYNAHALSLHGEFARLNVIPDEVE